MTCADASPGRTNHLHGKGGHHDQTDQPEVTANLSLTLDGRYNGPGGTGGPGGPGAGDLGRLGELGELALVYDRALT